MSQQASAPQQRLFRQWLASSAVIERFLAELMPHLPAETHQHNARAILARLAGHEPAIHTCYADEIRWEDEQSPGEIARAELDRLRAELEALGCDVDDAYGSLERALKQSRERLP